MKSVKPQSRACAVCGSREKSLLLQQRFSTLSSGSLLDGYDVVVCRVCGFGFANDVPEQAVFDQYYESMSKYENHQRSGRESEFRSARFREIVDLVRRFLPNRSTRVLEVGCATGHLLFLLKEAGYSNVVGVDPSPACAAAAGKLYGVQVVAGTIWHLSVLEQPCDLLVLVGVLEHIRDLAEALGQVRGVLCDGGLVFIEVPDATRFASRPDAPFQEFSTEHINFFSPMSLANLMGAHSFEEVHLELGEVEQNVGTISPVVSGLYRKRQGPAARPHRDETTERGLCRYIDWSAGVDGRIRETIDRLVRERVPIVVWGVGTHTSRLMATSRLAEADIRAFVDSNPHYHGKTMNSLPILAPAELRARPEPILISSRVFQHEIELQIRNELGCSNELILLYEVTSR
jgi:SAM-dependent methyltransferase